MSGLFRRNQRPSSKDSQTELAKADERLSDLRERVAKIRATTKVVTIRSQRGKMQPER